MCDQLQNPMDKAPPAETPPERTLHIVALLAILIAALLARTWRLGAAPFWYDEIIHLQKILGMTPTTFFDSQFQVEPAFWLPMRLWLTCSLNEVWVRLYAVIAGMATVGISYAIGLRWNRRAALFMAGAAALAPFYVYYSREAKMYSQLVFCCAAASWVLLAPGALRRGDKKGPWLLFLVSCCVIHTHLLGGILLAAMHGALLLTHPEYLKRRNYVVTNLAVLAASLPYALQTLAYGRHRMAVGHWTPVPDGRRIFNAWCNLISGFSASTVVAAGLSLLLASLLLYALFKQSNRRAVVFLALCGLLQFTLFTILSLTLPASIFLERYMASCALPLFWCAALGAAALPSAAARSLTILLFAGLCLPSIHAIQQGQFQGASPAMTQRFEMPNPDVRGMAAYLRERVKPGMYVVNLSWPVHCLMRWYAPEIPMVLADEDDFQLAILQDPADSRLLRFLDFAPESPQDALQRGRRFFLIEPKDFFPFNPRVMDKIMRDCIVTDRRAFGEPYLPAEIYFCLETKS